MFTQTLGIDIVLRISIEMPKFSEEFSIESAEVMENFP